MSVPLSGGSEEAPQRQRHWLDKAFPLRGNMFQTASAQRAAGLPLELRVEVYTRALRAAEQNKEDYKVIRWLGSLINTLRDGATGEDQLREAEGDALFILRGLQLWAFRTGVVTGDPGFERIFLVLPHNIAPPVHHRMPPYDPIAVLSVKLSWTVADVKALIERQENVLSGDQVLIFIGTILADRWTLREYGIGDNGVLNLTVRGGLPATY